MAQKAENYRPICPPQSDALTITQPIEVITATPQVHCTSLAVSLYVENDDEECVPFEVTRKCFSDNSETITATGPSGTTYTTEASLMANAKPYTPSATNEVCAFAQIEDHYMVGGAAATVQDLIDAALTAEGTLIASPQDATLSQPVDLTDPNIMISSWSLNVLPCEADVVLFDGTPIIVADGDDSARIGGLKSTGDSDEVQGGVDTTKTLADYNAGTVFQLCVTFKNCITVKG